jgi:hypothetical protein
MFTVAIFKKKHDNYRHTTFLNTMSANLSTNCGIIIHLMSAEIIRLILSFCVCCAELQLQDGSLKQVILIKKCDVQNGN